MERAAPEFAHLRDCGLLAKLAGKGRIVATEEVDHTVLREAGVVDSGCAGLLRLLEGALAYLRGEDAEDARQPDARTELADRAVELADRAVEGAMPLLHIRADRIVIEGQRHLQDRGARTLAHGRRVASIRYPSPPAVRDRSGRSAAW